MPRGKIPPLQCKATQVDRQIGLVLAPETIASDPINATPAEIAAHVMPPQPDPVTDPANYKLWMRAMAARKTRIFPVLTKTNVVPAAEQIVTTDGSNGFYTWAGYALISPTKNALRNIIGTITQQSVTQPSGTCSASTYVSATWAGLDGFPGASEPALLQAGTEADVTCTGGTMKPNYYAWFCWCAGVNSLGIPVTGETGIPSQPPIPPVPPDQPNKEYMLVTPGDEYYLQVWATEQLNATSGYVYIGDETTGVVFGPQLFNAPTGAYLHGDVGEWITEIPQYCEGNSCMIPPLAGFLISDRDSPVVKAGYPGAGG